MFVLHCKKSIEAWIRPLNIKVFAWVTDNRLQLSTVSHPCTWFIYISCAEVISKGLSNKAFIRPFPSMLLLFPGLIRTGLLQELVGISPYWSAGVLCNRGRSQLQQSRGTERCLWGSGLQQWLSGPAGLHCVTHQHLVRISVKIELTARIPASLMCLTEDHVIFFFFHF